MKGNVSRVVRYGAGLLGLVTLGWVLTGQATKPVLEGLPTDWSHRHLIFSQPASARQVERITQDPRYWQQWYRHNVARVLASGGEASAEMPSWNTWHRRSGAVYRDWSEDLGNLGAPLVGGNYPAKFTYGITTATCASAPNPDYVVFSTGLAGSASQASVVAYDNLYAGCTAPVPAVFWAYNTGGQILTSPIISGDGQVAFVQTAGGAATLVLLKWAPGGTVGSPAAITSVPTSGYRYCAVPCMTTINLKDNVGNPTDDQTSSAYPDYTNDIIWVGGTLGWLHKITGVFRSANPAEANTGGFPVQMTAGATLSSPVYDFTSGNVFVGDYSGYLYRVVASTGQVFQSARVDHGAGLVAGPVVDSTSGRVYAFSSNDGSTACPGLTACAGVFQFVINFAANASGTEVRVGTSAAAPKPMYEGAFDAAYRASVNATGNLYVCGNTGVNPILYRVPIAAGVFGAAQSIAPLTAVPNHRVCSPVTDISNPNTTIVNGFPFTVATAERVFFSVQNNARPTICAAGGCAMSFVTMPWQSRTAYTVGQEILVYRPANNTLYINVVTGGGTSGASVPTWPAAIATLTFDGTVTWVNQGATTVLPLAIWQAGHVYAARARIIDGNGNVEVVRVGGTSGAPNPPVWATMAGVTTADGTVTWMNAGVLPSAGLPAAGGTGGIIMDNVVAQGTMNGASQVYFSTLNNQVCPTSGGTGGCAVQASQAALK